MVDIAQLRPATPQDLDPIHAVCWQSLSHEAAHDKLDWVLRFAQKGRGLAMVATTADEGIVGYGQWLMWRERAEIADLFVKDTWRSRGIGTALITHLRQDALRHTQLVEIGVRADNPRALALYQRLGFVVTHTHQRAYHPPTIYLEWRNTLPSSNGIHTSNHKEIKPNGD
jgi:ribosomal protein S18 acetylase RimI-like enzyme